MSEQRAPRVMRNSRWIKTWLVGVENGFERYEPTAKWPPPQPGSHESDLYRNNTIAEFHDRRHSHCWPLSEFDDFMAAQHWSRTSVDA